MELTITDLNVEMTNENKKQIKQKTHKVFERFYENIQKVTLTLNDVNGPKGGDDKVCKVVIHTRGMPDIVVTDNKSVAMSAVNTALSRARSTLIKKLKRKQKNMPAYQVQANADTLENARYSIRF